MGLKRKKKKCPTVKLDKAEQIVKQYQQLSSCCNVLAEISPSNESNHYDPYTGGWKIRAGAITSAGINIEEVYAHIGRLANAKRAELECELAKLEV